MGGIHLIPPDPPHASFYGNALTWTQAAAVQNTWYLVSDAAMADGSGGLNSFTHDGNGKLTALVGGGYILTYDLDGDSNTAGKAIESGVAVNGTVISDARAHIVKANASQPDSMSSTGHIRLNPGDTVELAIRTTDAGAPTLEVVGANLTIFRIGGG